MNIGITNDHHGVEINKFLTEYLTSLGYNVINYGATTSDPVDYPDCAKKLGKAILNKEVDFGITICRTGIGMSIAMNKIKGIYCAKVSNKGEAALTRYDNNANAISISEEMDREEMKEVIKTFLETPLSNLERHKRINDIVKEMEENV